jgi:hypothetical protein
MKAKLRRRKLHDSPLDPASSSSVTASLAGLFFF